MKPEILEGSRGRRTPSLYQLYLGGGEPSLSWQDRTAFLPVVTEVGTLHRGGDGGTAGQRFSCQQRHTLKSADQNLKDLYPEQSASLGPLLAARCRTPHSRTRRYPSGSLWRTSGCCRTSSPGWSTDLWKNAALTERNQTMNELRAGSENMETISMCLHGLKLCWSTGSSAQSSFRSS